MVEQSLFQEVDGGSIPTSPLQLFFKQTNKGSAALAYSKWHYLGDTPFISQIDYGAYFNGCLCGAISYGSPNATELKNCFNRHTQFSWYEIKRLAMSPICPKNSESRFIAITIKLLMKMADVTGIITYADSGVGHVGTIYKASGFEYVGLTKQKKDFYVNGKIQQRGKVSGVSGEWKDRSQKHLFIKRIKDSAKNPSYNTRQGGSACSQASPKLPEQLELSGIGQLHLA